MRALRRLPVTTSDSAVPSMSLQPLVENAVRHGIGQSISAGRIAVCAARTDGALEVTISDDGPGLPATAQNRGHGIGLANTRARLRALYGAEGVLSVENGPQGGAIATLRVPYREAHEAVDAHR